MDPRDYITIDFTPRSLKYIFFNISLGFSRNLTLKCLRFRKKSPNRTNTVGEALVVVVGIPIEEAEVPREVGTELRTTPIDIPYKISYTRLINVLIN